MLARKGTSSASEEDGGADSEFVKMLARKASPYAKSRVEQLMEQLNEEISRIARAESDDGTASMDAAAGQRQEGNGDGDADSIETTLARATPNESGIVERLCDRVVDMQSALEGLNQQPEVESIADIVSLEDDPADASSPHQLSQLEHLICNLQSQVEASLPRVEVMEAARHDQMRMKMSELETQKLALEDEIMTLQRKKEDLSASRGSWTVQTSAIQTSASSSWPGGTMAAPAKPMVPPLQLSAMRVKQPAPAVSPPHSGRKDQTPAQAHMALSAGGGGSMLMPVAVSGGQTLVAVTPRVLQAPIGAAQEDTTPAISVGPALPLPAPGPIATSSTVRLAVSPRPARVGSLTMMVNSVSHAAQRAVTPGMHPRPGLQENGVLDTAGQPPGQRIWAYPALAGSSAQQVYRRA